MLRQRVLSLEHIPIKDFLVNRLNSLTAKVSILASVILELITPE